MIKLYAPEPEPAPEPVPVPPGCARAVSDLFEKYGSDVILTALATRLREESAVAMGEDDPPRARNFAALADQLDEIG